MPGSIQRRSSTHPGRGGHSRELPGTRVEGFQYPQILNQQKAAGAAGKHQDGQGLCRTKQAEEQLARTTLPTGAQASPEGIKSSWLEGKLCRLPGSLARAAVPTGTQASPEGTQSCWLEDQLCCLPGTWWLARGQEHIRQRCATLPTVRDLPLLAEAAAEGQGHVRQVHGRV